LTKLKYEYDGVRKEVGDLSNKVIDKTISNEEMQKEVNELREKNGRISIINKKAGGKLKSVVFWIIKGI
jgi:cell division protein FtsL